MFFDQPSQAYFSADSDEEAEITDEDRAAAAKMYRLAIDRTAPASVFAKDLEYFPNFGLMVRATRTPEAEPGALAGRMPAILWR